MLLKLRKTNVIISRYFYRFSSWQHIYAVWYKMTVSYSTSSRKFKEIYCFVMVQFPFIIARQVVLSSIS